MIGRIQAVVGALFFLCYAYQFIYLAVALRRCRTPSTPGPQRRIAVLIAARNEEAVVGQLIDSITAQTYPADRYTVFVVADNCTDNTAGVALAHGATVLRRQDSRLVGKGYALQYLLERVERLSTDAPYDAFLVLDADNLLAPGYLTAMDRALTDHRVVTGYRNSKNYGDNWISAGYALWFLRESQLNRARARLRISCVVAGTGFAFTRQVMEQQGGWPFHSLTEDTEFTAEWICRGETIGYCEDAQLYDEQPVRFSQSVRQRMRWAKGYFRVLQRYGGRLLSSALRGRFAGYDLVAAMLPAFLASVATLLLTLIDLVVQAVVGGDVAAPVWRLAHTVAGTYGTLLLLGGVTLVTEWRHIRATVGRKVGFWLLFPAFMLTYVPVALAALVCPVEWTPIAHTRTLPLDRL